jgi:formate dehydrogenase maturation protein FdhE
MFMHAEKTADRLRKDKENFDEASGVAADPHVAPAIRHIFEEFPGAKVVCRVKAEVLHGAEGIPPIEMDVLRDEARNAWMLDAFLTSFARKAMDDATRYGKTNEALDHDPITKRFTALVIGDTNVLRSEDSVWMLNVTLPEEAEASLRNAIENGADSRGTRFDRITGEFSAVVEGRSSKPAETKEEPRTVVLLDPNGA